MSSGRCLGASNAYGLTSTIKAYLVRIYGHTLAHQRPREPLPPRNPRPKLLIRPSIHAASTFFSRTMGNRTTELYGAEIRCSARWMICSAGWLFRSRRTHRAQQDRVAPILARDGRDRALGVEGKLQCSGCHGRQTQRVRHFTEAVRSLTGGRPLE